MHICIDFFKFLKNKNKKIHILNQAAQLCYRMLLAFFPSLMLFYNFITSLSKDPNSILLALFNTLLPTVYQSFQDNTVFSYNASNSSLITNVLFSIFFVYAAALSIRSLIIIVTRVMSIPETRGFIGLWLLAFKYLFRFVIVFLGAFYFYFLTQSFDLFIVETFNVPTLYTILWRWASLLYIFLVVSLILLLIYMYLPALQIPFSKAFPGVLFTITTWILAIVLKNGFFDFQILDIFFQFNSILMVILMIYFMCITVILGALLNLFFIERTKATHETQ